MEARAKWLTFWRPHLRLYLFKTKIHISILISLNFVPDQIESAVVGSGVGLASQKQLTDKPIPELIMTQVCHDDVIKWKHFPRNWPFVRGIHVPVPVNSPHKGQWRGALMLSLICVWINGWVNNREAGDLRRYRGHYDVIVMRCTKPQWVNVSLIYRTKNLTSVQTTLSIHV